MSKLYSTNLGGNLHEAVSWVNKAGVADYVIHMESPRGTNTVVVLRHSDDLDIEALIERNLRAYFKEHSR